MNEQEMQFANPDWQPSSGQPAAPVEQEVPMPVNAARLGWQEREGGSGPTYEEREQLSAFPPAYQQTPFQPRLQMIRPQRRRSWWWAIVFVLLVWLVPALLWSFPSRYSNAFGGPGSFQKPFQMDSRPYTYDMTHISTVTINDPLGYIHVHSAAPGTTTGQVVVQSVDAKEKPIEFVPGKDDGSLTIQVNPSSDGGPVELDVTLPQNMALNLTSNGGDIEVDGMQGQVNLQTDTDTINLSNDAISGQSNISAGAGKVIISNSSFSGTYTIASSSTIILSDVNMSGHGQVQAQGEADIQMNGTLDAQGTYGFSSDSGVISLLLPGNTPIHFTIDPGTGSVNNQFPSSSGKTPQAQVNLKTNSGGIDVRPNT